MVGEKAWKPLSDRFLASMNILYFAFSKFNIVKDSGNAKLEFELFQNLFYGGLIYEINVIFR